MKRIESICKEIRARSRNAARVAWFVMTTESPVYRSPTFAFIREMLVPSDKSRWSTKQEPDAEPESLTPGDS